MSSGKVKVILYKAFPNPLHIFVKTHLIRNLGVGEDFGADTHSEDVRAILCGYPVQLYQAFLFQKAQFVTLGQKQTHLSMSATWDQKEAVTFAQKQAYLLF